MNQTKPGKQNPWVTSAWGLALVVLVIYAIRHIGGFDLTSTLENGRTVPNMYATVDHPFHASRAAMLLNSLKDGEILRWIGSHQGGYPVEFYPLGVAWLDVALWAALLGSVPILAVHKLVLALVFVLPSVAYWLLVRGDGLHPSVAFLATAFHLAIPGYWLNGGYEELIGWGLVTNVAGATFALIATVLLARYVFYRHHWCGVGAILMIALATVSNPRSLFGVVLAALAIGIWGLVVTSELPIRQRLIDTSLSISLVGVLSFLLAAPVILALLRFNGSYFFLHYQFYKPIGMYWDALVMALSLRILLAGIAGGVVLIAIGRRFQLRVSQSLALTALFYSLLTVWVATTTNPPPLVEQLEAPRLMPFQRLLMLVLAAVVIVWAVQQLTAQLHFVWRESIIVIVVIGLGWGSVYTMTHRDPHLPLNDSAMYLVPTVGDLRFADLEDSVQLANDLRPNGASIFVIGNQHEWWHEQLWAPSISAGTYYFDDWLWYWHRDQPGPYDNQDGYFMPNPTDALTEVYFSEHGIGAVLVSDMWVPYGIPPREAARTNEMLSLQGSFGSWDVYTVKSPSSLSTREGRVPAEIEWSNQRIDASYLDGQGSILVRQNWFPRWQAEVNGEPAAISRSDAGYMIVDAPDGPVRLTLTYGVTGLDWAARVMTGLGVVGTMAFASQVQRLRLWSVGEEV